MTPERDVVCRRYQRRQARYIDTASRGVIAVPVDVREAAGAIRPYLPRLLGDRAPEMDTALGVLLGTGDDEALAAQLAGDPITEAWTATFLETGLPPEFTERDRGYSPPPGRGERVDARRYACPQGDFIWYERSVIERPPLCPTHGVAVEAT